MNASQSDSSGTPSKSKEAGVRWHKIAIDQLGYALNLILTFTIAALGYCFVLLRDKDFTPASSAKSSLIFALSILAVSALCGLACVIVRVWDFRGTARRASNHPEAPSKEDVRILDRVTWWLFFVQLAAFALGVIALAYTLLLTYGWKLT
jgi:polyferredoxin